MYCNHCNSRDETVWDLACGVGVERHRLVGEKVSGRTVRFWMPAAHVDAGVRKEKRWRLDVISPRVAMSQLAMLSSRGLRRKEGQAGRSDKALWSFMFCLCFAARAFAKLLSLFHVISVSYFQAISQLCESLVIYILINSGGGVQ